MKLAQDSGSGSFVAVLAVLAAFVPGIAQATPVPPEILAQIGPPVPNPGLTQEQLIEMGRRVFMEQTFDGNGRTCATCHPPSNNFTIDPAFINTLPNNDPLFVAENDPNLELLEDSELLRRFGLITENIDGFDQPGVLRGVPHTLALPTSINGRARELIRGDGSQVVHATGWSADGSPGDGSLRQFAVGAVFQHFPKTLNRIPGEDFRLPTAIELDALEAFQMSLGRQVDPDLSTMTFADSGGTDVNRGKALFTGQVDSTEDECTRCHTNAGATRNGENRIFETGVALLASPARQFDPNMPGDGGFDTTPVTMALGVEFRGNNFFNVPPLIEAADTPPFFHNNVFDTLEEVIEFYTDDTRFVSDRAVFVLTEQQIEEIADFLRTLSALENIRSCAELAEQAQRQREQPRAFTLEVAVTDTEDAIEVLNEGAIYADAVEPLMDALEMLQDAVETPRPSFRNALLGSAIDLCLEARGIILVE